MYTIVNNALLATIEDPEYHEDESGVIETNANEWVDWLYKKPFNFDILNAQYPIKIGVFSGKRASSGQSKASLGKIDPKWLNAAGSTLNDRRYTYTQIYDEKYDDISGFIDFCCYYGGWQRSSRALYDLISDIDDNFLDRNLDMTLWLPPFKEKENIIDFKEHNIQTKKADVFQVIILDKNGDNPYYLK